MTWFNRLVVEFWNVVTGRGIYIPTVTVNLVTLLLFVFYYYRPTLYSRINLINGLVLALGPHSRRVLVDLKERDPFFLFYPVPKCHTRGARRELIVKLFWKQGYFVFVLCPAREFSSTFALCHRRRTRAPCFFSRLEIYMYSKFKEINNKKMIK